MRILLICVAALALTSCQKRQEPQDPTRFLSQYLVQKYGLDRVIVGDLAEDVCAFAGYVPQDGYRVTVLEKEKVYSGTACEDPRYRNSWSLSLDAGSVFLNGNDPIQ